MMSWFFSNVLMPAVDWFNNHVLLPVLNILYVPCDWILGWTERFPAVVSVSIVGVLSGLGSILIQKYGSNQKLLGQCQADLDFLKQKIKRAKAEGRTEAVTRAQALSNRIGMKKFVGTLRPSLFTIPLFIVVASWAGSRLGYLPIRPGQEMTVAAHFENQARGFAYVLPNDAFKPVSPPIAPLVDSPCLPGSKETDPHATWTLRADKDGDHRITIRGAGKSYEVVIPVASKGGYPPDPVVVLQGATPTEDQLQAVEIRLTDSMPAKWWNLGLQWMGLYCVVVLAAWLLFRKVLGVH